MARRPNLEEYEGDNLDDECLDDIEAGDVPIMDLERADEWETAMCPKELRDLLDARAPRFGSSRSGQFAPNMPNRKVKK